MKRFIRGVMVLAVLAFATACGNGGTNPFLTSDAGNEDGGNDEGDASGDCAGCVDSEGECVDGDRLLACGAGGDACVECLADQLCTEGRCVDAPDCRPDNCDGCCDASGECLGGGDDAACGAGGLACTSCNPGTSCEDGECVRGCGPDSCPGCCSADGECLSGETDTSCGGGGGACTDCASIGAECDDSGSCVEPGCAATCMGCCNEGECVNPPFDAQCGIDGAACVACGDARACIDGACTVDPASLWKVFIANGEVAEKNPAGEDWDGGFYIQPDPYVWVTTVDPDSGEEHSNFTSEVDDTLSPTWDESPVTAPARALFDGLTLEYYDDDLADDDLICTIEITDLNAESPAFDGLIIESECPDEPASKIRWKLEPQ